MQKSSNKDRTRKLHDSCFHSWQKGVCGDCGPALPGNSYDRVISKRNAKEEIMNGITRYETVEESGGDIFTMEDFVEMTKCYAIMNDDGAGYLSDGKVIWNIEVDCRQLCKGIIPKNVSAFPAEFTHVVWFNK